MRSVKKSPGRHSAALLPVVLCGTLFLLSACGGGGSSSRPPPVEPIVDPIVEPPVTQLLFPRHAPDATSVLLTPDDEGYGARKQAFAEEGEYQAWLARMNAAAAYARGASGAGETVVVMDTGLRETHLEFTDTTLFLTKTPGYTPTPEQKFHGTAVASVAVGGRDNIYDGGSHGIAFNANLHFIEVALSAPPPSGEYEKADVESAASQDQDSADFFGLPIAQGRGAIINFSFSIPGAISQYNRDLLRRSFRLTAARLAQAETDAADRKILVWAAGNAGVHLAEDPEVVIDSPELLAGLAVHFPELQGHSITVVGLDEEGRIADYSNRCGIAKGFCIAAPGQMYAASYRHDREYLLRAGTSLAAPLVSGSLALLRHYFRNPDGSYQLGNSELVARLLATANRRGIYANSDIYGHGLVDLDAATAPVGTMRSSLPQDPLALPLAEAWVELYGGAFGPRLERALAAIPLTAFDELGAPFPYTVTGQLQRPRPSAELPRALRLRRAVAQSATGLITRLEMVGNNLGSDGEEMLLSVAAPSGVSSLEDHREGHGRRYGNGGYNRNDGRSGRYGNDRHNGNSGRGWWFSWGRHAGLSLGLYRDLPTAAAQGFLHRAAFAAPWLSLVQQGPSFGATLPLPSGGRIAFALLRGTPRQDGAIDAAAEVANGAGLVLDYQPGISSLSLQAGFVQEEESFLGARPHGVFGSASGNTLFTGFNRHWSLGEHWRALASAHLGITQAQFSAAGLLHDAKPLYSSAFSVAVERSSWWRKGDWAGLRISQPLRIESGSAALRVANGRTRYGEILYEQRNISLRPSGRTLQAEAAWRGHFTIGELFLSLGLEHQAEQDTRQALQFQGALQYRHTF